MPAVTFILPMYRGEATLPGCLESLRAQRFTDWECIGVDDASPDRCAEIFAAAAAGDKRLRLVRHASNSGVGAARATGFGLASGFAVHLLDQDDHLAPDGVGSALRALRREDSTPAVYGNFVVFDTRNGRRLIHDDMPEELGFAALLQGPPLCPVAVLHRRSAVETAGGLVAGLDNCDDWDLWARLARLGPPLRHVPVILGEWRVHAANNSRSALTTLRSGLAILERMHGPDPRVASPSVAWSAGADLPGKPDRLQRFVWLQIANLVARRDVGGAVEVARHYVATYGPEALPPHSAAHLDPAMPFARTLAGAEADSYFEDLVEVLEALFTELEGLLHREGFTLAAMRALSLQHIRQLVAAKRALAGSVEAYRRSRSYRLGRFLTSGGGVLAGERRGGASGAG